MNCSLLGVLGEMSFGPMKNEVSGSLTEVRVMPTEGSVPTILPFRTLRTAMRPACMGARVCVTGSTGEALTMPAM